MLAFLLPVRFVLFLSLAGGLGACGGSGCGGSAANSYGVGSTNTKPTLSLASSIQVDENQTDVITVSASMLTVTIWRTV